jgi:hypothetical protein
MAEITEPIRVEDDTMVVASIKTTKPDGRGYIIVQLLDKNKHLKGEMRASALHGENEKEIGYASFTMMVPAYFWYQFQLIGDINGGVRIWPG